MWVQVSLLIAITVVFVVRLAVSLVRRGQRH